MSGFSIGAAFALRGPVAGVIGTLVVLLAIPALTLARADWATQLASFLPTVGGPGIFGQGPLDLQPRSRASGSRAAPSFGPKNPFSLVSLY